MDAGMMVEFDHPYNLLRNEDGFLYKMVEQTGSETSELLHNIALEVPFEVDCMCIRNLSNLLYWPTDDGTFCYF